ncbi:MAG TPA: PAS domain-containing protein [Solirubrobacteraceae bacterium]|nr:PAS domain-containing protein [Solirubrobacteraceae bacterium]
MPTARIGRPALRLITPLEHEAPAPLVAFCSHCGARPTPPPNVPAATQSRVCASCGLGLILESPADAAPSAGDAFLVLDHSLAVCAVSEAAERLLATSEPDVVNRHVSDLLMAAEAEEKNGAGLSAAVAWAARGDVGTRTAVVRPANTFGIRLTARIASCGPPRAALLVLE